MAVHARIRLDLSTGLSHSGLGSSCSKSNASTKTVVRLAASDAAPFPAASGERRGCLRLTGRGSSAEQGRSRSYIVLARPACIVRLAKIVNHGDGTLPGRR
jgi:hypothetical protein